MTAVPAQSDTRPGGSGAWRGVLGLALVTVAYVSVLLWVDARGHIFDSVSQLAAALPLMFAAALANYFIRYLRWHWLLQRAGCPVPFWAGLPAYLAGFAFTATPGKVGELVRIRYFEPLGVPSWRVLATFVFERLLDLLVVLALSCLAIRRVDLLLVAMAFTFLAVGLVLTLAWWPAGLDWVIARLEKLHALRLARVAGVLRNGLVGCRTWVRAADVFTGALLGLVAWGFVALSFLYMTGRLDLPVPVLDALAIYPVSMIVGAASMLPGGLGSTEATITVLLAAHGVALPLAVLAAVAIRLSTLWFAIVCGMLALFGLEWHRGRRAATARACARLS